MGMRLSLLPRAPLLSTLSLLVLLTALPARADLPTETIYLSRAEISDEALRGVIGVVFISAMTGPDEQPLGEVPSFRPEGDAFEPDGPLALKDLRALSGWDYDLQSLRKFPVVGRRGHYLHVVIDVHTNERAWISEIQEDEAGPDVEFLSFDSNKWEWSGIELYHLAPKGQSRLYLAPRLEARSHPLSPDYPPRRNGEFADARIIKVRGNFLQLGAMFDMDQPLEPLGWVPISDENGLLLIWPVYAPMC
jgi:hypothetical protein